MLRRRYNGFLPSVFLVAISLLPITSATLSVTASFNQSGINGTITFTQEAPDGNTTIDVSLTGKGEREKERERESIKLKWWEVYPHISLVIACCHCWAIIPFAH